jgi:hypothetical protein
VADQVRQAEPINRERYHRLVGRLMHLLLTGDGDGQHPAGDPEPWVVDDATEIISTTSTTSDTITAARIDWTAAGLAQPESERR